MCGQFCTHARLKHYLSVRILFLSVLLGMEEVNGSIDVSTMNTLPILTITACENMYASVQPNWHVKACLTHHEPVLSVCMCSVSAYS